MLFMPAFSSFHQQSSSNFFTDSCFIEEEVLSIYVACLLILLHLKGFGDTNKLGEMRGDVYVVWLLLVGERGKDADENWSSDIEGMEAVPVPGRKLSRG